ncbi:Ig-like domain-containing protein [Paenibacillus sp. XY044]|uniref:Ig-like domain-containing protein n=1 Tax=Paenibacillus sp. XY044 TaxID=2026089 RepID=UPI00117E1EC0|nr:Ig-like domain-containing protein [Paenibacillus sp. XY044]
MIIIAGALPLTTINKASASDEAAAVQTAGSVSTPASDEAVHLAESPSQGTSESDTEPLTATVVVAKDKLVIGDSSTVTIMFSRAVTGFTIAYLKVGNGTLGPLTSSSDKITYTATLVPLPDIQIKDNVITLDLAGVEDASGNPGTGTAKSNNYEIDTKRPTATVVVDDDKLGIDQTSLVTITFSEAVTGFILSDMTAENGILSEFSTSDNITYTAKLTPTSGINAPNNVITLNYAGVKNAATGNPGMGTTKSNNYEIDILRPTATITIANSKLIAGQTTTVTFTFSEAVAGFDLYDLTVANGTLSNLISSDGGRTWAATLTPASGIRDKTNIITLNNTGVADLAGNAGVGTTNSASYEISTVRPTSTIEIDPDTLAIGGKSQVTITFSQAVTGLDYSALTVANGTLTNVSSGDGGVTWTAELTPNADVSALQNAIQLDNTHVTNMEGNKGTGTTKSNNYEIDTLRPTATIVVADNELKTGETTLVTIAFSEGVLGFNLSGLTVSNGTLSNLTSIDDGGTTWTVTLTPKANVYAADNFITLDNSMVHDAAGNSGQGLTKSNPYTVVTVPASAELSDLTISSGSLSPAFVPGTTNYTSSVPYAVSSLKVNATTQDSSATLTVNGSPVASGQQSKDISLSVGANSIKVVVIAEDQSTKTYTISVTRANNGTHDGGGSGSNGSGGGSSGGSTTPVLPGDNKWISTDGKLTIPPGKAGEVRLGDAVTISIPAGATNQELKLTIEKVPDTHQFITHNEVFLSPVFELSKNVPGYFDKPVTLSFAFDPASLKNNQTAAVFYYDEAKKIWIMVPVSRIQENRIAVTVDHFTKFAVLAIDQTTGLTVISDPAKFGDIFGHWAEASIEQAASTGIVTGYPDGTFKPGKTVTRAEFAEMLVNTLGVKKTGAELNFIDSASIGAWAHHAVAQVVQLGMMKGYENGTFRPNAEITRAEMAVTITNTVGWSSKDNTEAGFADDSEIPDWAKGSAVFLKQTGIMQGKDGNRFAPQDAATRAEAVTILLNMFALQG